MLRSLFSGVSGMRNNQTKMDVIGNNIANVNTTSFKSGRVRFQDILSQTLKNAQSPALGGRGGVNARQVGLGTQVAGVDTIVNQGALQPTGRPLDCAIEGEGYFVLSDGVKEVYSRDGAFNFDKDNNIVNSDGFKLKGYLPNTAIMRILYKDDLSDTNGLNWSNVTGASAMKQASTITITGPLSTTGTTFSFTAGQTLASIKTGIDLGSTVNFSTATKIRLGGSGTDGTDVTLNNIKSLGNGTGTGYDAITNIDTVVSKLQSDIDVAGLGKDYTVGKDGNKLTITSSSTGKAVAVELTGSDAATGANILGFTDLTRQIGVIGTINEKAAQTGVTASVKDGGLMLEAKFDIDDRANPRNKIDISTSAGDFAGLTPLDNVGVLDAVIDETSFNDTTTLKSLSIPELHPLRPNVKINNFSIEPNGTIKGVYDDGSIMSLGKVALAKFINPAGLLKLGGNNYGTSGNSGDANIVAAGEDGSGSVQQSNLEMSNVDLANEFTDMIITSRAFQANSRTITTSDEMLQELLNLKR